MKNKLTELAALFFKLGVIGFGGPAAHIAMMEEEVVTRRKWLTREHFLDLMGATNLIPGPNSTEMAIHVGYHRAGLAGLAVAGICFLIPAITLTFILAYFYVAYRSVPNIEPLLMGIKPAVILLIANAVFKLGKKALKSVPLAVLGAIIVVIALMGTNPFLVVVGGGLVGMLLLSLWDNRQSPKAGYMLLAAPVESLTDVATPAIITTVSVFFAFLKIGSILFGSGYVLIAFLETELVNNLGWLNAQELLDAVAIGQFTPGPVLSTATFVGYLVDGGWGAVAATLGIFLPSFVFVALLNPLVPKMRNSVWMGRFLDAVNVCALGLMAGITLKLAATTLVDWQSITIAVFGAIAVFWLKLSPLWIVAIGSIMGLLLSMIVI
ncbi:MAG: chromate efflux transporter [Calditrichia bacterium]